MARKVVTVSMTFEAVLDVDEGTLKKAQAAMTLTAAGAYLMMADPSTKLLERELECAVVLNVEDPE